MTQFDVYRIGGGKRYPHWAHRWHVDRWFRSWQCEWREDCMWACRAWTRAGALRKAARWKRNNVDLRKHEQRYGRSDLMRETRGLT